MSLASWKIGNQIENTAFCFWKWHLFISLSFSIAILFPGNWGQLMNFFRLTRSWLKGGGDQDFFLLLALGYGTLTELPLVWLLCLWNLWSHCYIFHLEHLLCAPGSTCNHQGDSPTPPESVLHVLHVPHRYTKPANCICGMLRHGGRDRYLPSSAYTNSLKPMMS